MCYIWATLTGQLELKYVEDRGLGGCPLDVPLQGCLGDSTRVGSGAVHDILEQHVVFWGCLGVMVGPRVILRFQGALHQSNHGVMVGDGVDIGQLRLP